MNYIKHLTGFFDKIVNDNSLNPTHISLYIGLFQFWNINRFVNPISITRDEIMRISKIYSKATYHKCIKDLNRKGYIIYQPSFNPFKGSLISVCDLSAELKPTHKRTNSNLKKTSNEDQISNNSLNKQQTGYQTSSEQVTEQALVPSINYINNTNISNKNNFENVLNLSKKNNFENENNLIFEKNQKEKSSAKKEKEDFVFSQDGEMSHNKKSNPVIEEVKNYFLENNFPEQEAYKFFFHFSSNGWLVGGKSPMVDWMSAAQNWMLNAPKFSSNEQQLQPNNLNVNNNKNYAEPL